MLNDLGVLYPQESPSQHPVLFVPLKYVEVVASPAVSHLCGGGSCLSVGLLRAASAAASTVHHVRCAQSVQVTAVLGVVNVVLEEHLPREERTGLRHYQTG